MKQLIAFLKQPKNLLVLSAAAALVGYMVFLIMATYWSQRDLQRSAAARFVEDERNRGRILSQFFLDKTADVKDLAGSRAIAVYFENMALGMTMEYGLRAGIFGMENRFKAFLQEKRLEGLPVYQSVVFVDAAGKTIAAAGEKGVQEVLAADRRHLATRGAMETSLILKNPEDALQGVMIAAPCIFKGNYVGETVVSMDMKTVDRFFFPSEKGQVQNRLVLSPEPAGEDALSQHVLFPAPETGPNGEKKLICRVPVNGTPFMLVATAPAASVYGETHPGRLLPATVALGALILGATFYFVGMDTRNRVLMARLDESAAREAEIQEKNAELEGYRLNLEKMVEERTLQLREAQQELLIKATEAGRAQMATVVLHNIGNAVTPVIVYVDQMKKDGLQRISRYLSRCLEDMKGHAADLTEYVHSNPRGKEVAAYMESLILELEEFGERRLSVLEKIQSALSYIAEILTLEQSYAPHAVQMEESVDLNVLVDDALRIQGQSIQQRNIQATKEAGDGPIWLRINKVRLMQTLINLIRNSCEAFDLLEASSENRRILIRVFEENGRSGFDIADTGVGLEMEKVEELFQFGKSLRGSSGFGLTYCREFVEANNGCIQVTSAGQGKGTTVRVEFPSPVFAGENELKRKQKNAEK